MLSFLQLNTRASVSTTTITGLSWRRPHPLRWPCRHVPIICLLADQKVRKCWCNGNTYIRINIRLKCLQHVTNTVYESLTRSQQALRISLDSPNLLFVFTTAVTQWCPGQVGGGWEETDSGNSSSHNSSQDIAANSRASVGSKSAGTGSQSGASRESSGDLSER